MLLNEHKCGTGNTLLPYPGKKLHMVSVRMNLLILFGTALGTSVLLLVFFVWFFFCLFVCF